MKTKEDIHSEIQELLGNQPSIDLNILYTQVPDFNTVHELMEADEKIKGYCIGLVNQTHVPKLAGKWLIICTNRHLIFLGKGAFSKKVDFRIPFNQLKSFKPQKGWLFGEIHINGDFPPVEIFHIGKVDYKFFIHSINSIIPQEVIQI